jgi:hypothetical protein
MAQLRSEDDAVVVRFGGWEAVLVGRRRLRIPLSAIRAAACVERPMPATTGLRVGLHVAGIVKIGRWGLGVGRRQLVSVRRAVPAARFTLDRDTTGYDEVLVSVPDAAGFLRSLGMVKQ